MRSPWAIPNDPRITEPPNYQGRYAICFDFPEMDGEPTFAGWYRGTPGFAPKLETAMRFDTESQADRFLENSYGPAVRECGKVVEVGS